MKKNKIHVLVESAIMIALAFVLSLVKVFRLPWGGSVTLLSMLPIVVFSIRNGVVSGLACSFVYSLVQLVQGIVSDGLLGWGLTPGMLAACIFLDYIAAFTVLGLAGAFRKRDMGGWIGGSIAAIMIRYALHVVSGAAIFASAGKLWESLEINNTWLYSAAYNACYMLPEMILTTIGAAVLFKSGAIKMILKGGEVKNTV
ncbi:MAG: energy-coupled thiamine transporter ThiT [Oscillospiraceae bacterium]|nr:energy-coupled thiamine transporter ThiT [Oscillospiraceae bacterium]